MAPQVWLTESFGQEVKGRHGRLHGTQGEKGKGRFSSGIPLLAPGIETWYLWKAITQPTSPVLSSLSVILISLSISSSSRQWSQIMNWYQFIIINKKTNKIHSFYCVVTSMGFDICIMCHAHYHLVKQIYCPKISCSLPFHPVRWQNHKALPDRQPFTSMISIEMKDFMSRSQHSWGDDSVYKLCPFSPGQNSL